MSEQPNLVVPTDEPMNDIQSPPFLDVAPDAVLELVQSQRLLLLLDSNADIDKSRLELMRDLSGTAMSSKRIVAETDIAASQQETARSFMQVINEGNIDPFKARVPVPKDITPIELNMDDMPDFDLLPNETSTENSNLDYDELFSETEE